MPKNNTMPFIVALLFSGSFIAARYSTADLGPLTTSLLRYTVALIFLTVLSLKMKSKTVPDKSEIHLLFWCGFTGIVGYHFFFFTALKYTEVANTAIINASSPILTSLFALILIKEKLRTRNYLGLLLATSGVLLLLTKGKLHNLTSLNFAFGDLLMLCSVINWIIYALLIKKLSVRLDGFCMTLYSTFFGVLILTPLSFWEGFLQQIHHIGGASFLSVLYMGIATSGIGYLLYNYCIKEIGPTRTSGIVYSFVPICVAILSQIFFKQPITTIMIFSTLLVISGLFLILNEKQ